MNLFVDTSAFLALLDRNERRADEVAAAWNRAVESDGRLCTSNYVIVETLALLQRRQGMDAVRAFLQGLLPLVESLFVSREAHDAAMAALLAANRRALSFVDCTSFELMRRRGIPDALALDEDFARQGFTVLPGAAG